MGGALAPAGTLRARRGLPLAVLTRGVLAVAFFGADAYVPLTLTSIRGASAAAAAAALTASTLAWTLGSWVQERRIDRWGPRRLIVAGSQQPTTGIAQPMLQLSPDPGRILEEPADAVVAEIRSFLDRKIVPR